MGAEDASDGEEGPPPETTEEELEERQEREVQELEERCSAHVEGARASAGKGKKAKAAVEAAEREAEQWQYELRERHGEELERLRRHLEGGGAPSAPVAAEGSPSAGTKSDAAAAAQECGETEEERIQRKKDKALKKRQGRTAKEAERQAEIEREKREAGPSARALELAALGQQLACCKPPLRVNEVAADGHCLYRAVGDQLRRVRPEAHQWMRPPEQVHEEVRSLCAQSLLKRPDAYSPFAELKDGEDFEAYCGRVERSGDWGGELELRALADCLGVRILVHRANEPKPLELGEGKGAPLQVTYHRHYYALGEHYNSAVPLGA